MYIFCMRVRPDADKRPFAYARLGEAAVYTADTIYASACLRLVTINHYPRGRHPGEGFSSEVFPATPRKLVLS